MRVDLERSINVNSWYRHINEFDHRGERRGCASVLGGDSDNFAAEVKKQEDNNPLQEIHLRPYEINALKQHDVHKLSKVLEANPGDLSKVYPEPDPEKLRIARKERDAYNESKRPGPPTARTLRRNENVLRI